MHLHTNVWAAALTFSALDVLSHFRFGDAEAHGKWWENLGDWKEIRVIKTITTVVNAKFNIKKSIDACFPAPRNQIHLDWTWLISQLETQKWFFFSQSVSTPCKALPGHADNNNLWCGRWYEVKSIFILVKMFEGVFTPALLSPLQSKSSFLAGRCKYAIKLWCEQKNK